MKVKGLPPSVPTFDQPAEVFRYLQRRDWELWSIALLLLTVFAGGLLAFLYRQTAEAHSFSPLVARFVWVVLFGLIAVVLLLNVYLIARKRALADLWRSYLVQQRELEQEREQGMLDPLTQVYNRRFFDEVIPKEVRRADRTSRPLSFLLVEVDEFKRINQRLGHFVGDQLLRGVAELLSSALRATDYTFRFGGDQFLLALPDTPPQGAAVVVKRLEAKLAAQKELHQRIGRPVTVSFGQATYVRGEKLEAVIEEAERALESARAGAPAARPAAADS